MRIVLWQLGSIGLGSLARAAWESRLRRQVKGCVRQSAREARAEEKREKWNFEAREGKRPMRLRIATSMRVAGYGCFERFLAIRVLRARMRK